MAFSTTQGPALLGRPPAPQPDSRGVPGRARWREDTAIEDSDLHLHDIPKVRFEALASYARHPAAHLFATEVRWLADDLELVLVIILLDTDDEYSAVLLARDLNERFRWVGSTDFFERAEDAAYAAEREVEEFLPDLADRRVQGDERSAAVDFFSPVRPRSKLNPAFL